MSVSGCSSCSDQTYTHTLPDGATSTIVTKPNGSVVSQSTTGTPANADGGSSSPTASQGAGSAQSAGLLDVTA